MTRPLTANDIADITGTKKFKLLPYLIIDSELPWHATVDELARLGADRYTWELAHYIAHVFDTYGDDVEEIQASWSSDTSQEKFILPSRLLFNACDLGLVCCNDSFTTTVKVEDRHQINERITRKDEGLALHFLHLAADNIPKALFNHIEALSARFASITSAQQAREIASAIDPKMLAIISEIGLDLHTDRPDIQHSRPPRRM